MSWNSTGAVADPFAASERYQIIYADPPWHYRDRAEAGRRGAGHKYPLLSDRDVAALPVREICAADAMLFLWVTWPKLHEVLPVIDAWGFSYRTVAFVWVKRTRISGALAWGMGSWTRANTEPCLLATRGRPKRLSASVHQVVEAPLARHSEKPAVVRERIVQLAGDLSRIELFARQDVPGWDVWGNDVGAAACAPSPVPRYPAASPAAAGRANGKDAQRAAQEWRIVRERAVRHLLAHGPATRIELADALDWSGDFAAATLSRLLREGAVSKQGRTRATRYKAVAPA